MTSWRRNIRHLLRKKNYLCIQEIADQVRDEARGKDRQRPEAKSQKQLNN